MTPLNDREIWYRYEDWRFADPVWDDNQPVTSHVQLKLIEIPVARRTPKGVQLDLGWRTRFVLKDANKRYACPTKEEAMASFKARKRRQIRILTAQLNSAKDALKLAEEGLLNQRLPFWLGLEDAS